VRTGAVSAAQVVVAGLPPRALGPAQPTPTLPRLLLPASGADAREGLRRGVKSSVSSALRAPRGCGESPETHQGWSSAPPTECAEGGARDTSRVVLDPHHPLNTQKWGERERPGAVCLQSLRVEGLRFPGASRRGALRPVQKAVAVLVHGSSPKSTTTLRPTAGATGTPSILRGSRAWLCHVSSEQEEATGEGHPSACPFCQLSPSPPTVPRKGSADSVLTSRQQRGKGGRVQGQHTYKCDDTRRRGVGVGRLLLALPFGPGRFPRRLPHVPVLAPFAGKAGAPPCFPPTAAEGMFSALAVRQRAIQK